MIKINGPNLGCGSGDNDLFSYTFYGDGSGEGIRFNYFNDFFGNGIGDGCYFGYRSGDGESYKLLKKEFQK